MAEAKRRPAGGTGFLTYRGRLEQPEPFRPTPAGAMPSLPRARRGRMEPEGKARRMTVVTKIKV